MAYTKLDSGITESTIWHAPDATLRVWIAMLARADQNGYVGASVPGLAALARVSLEACVDAVAQLSAPDTWSRTKEHEGRRIAEADGGWVLLNHSKYRAKQTADDRRERSRIAMAALRAERKQLAGVNLGGKKLRKLSQAEAEAEAVTSPTSPRPLAVVGTSALRTDPPPPPPAFDGTNAEALNGRAVVPLAAGFELPGEWGLDAEKLGFKPVEVAREAERMRQWATVGKGAGTRRSVKGWRQTWSNWLGKASKDQR